MGLGVGMRLREPLETTEAEVERGSETLGVEPDILPTGNPQSEVTSV